MRKQRTKPKAPRYRPLILAAAALILVIAVIAVPTALENRNQGTATGQFQPATTEATRNIHLDDQSDVGIDLGRDLEVTRIGSYTGIYMEDGSDEVVSRVLMVEVTNNGTSTVQYAEVTLTDGETTASFSLTTLPPGESVVLLELNRMSYDDGKDLTEAAISNVALFSQEPSLNDDRILVQCLDGVVNITNVSGSDIIGDIVVYYKNSASGQLYGGITYRVTVSGGLARGEVRQITASHITASGSRIMFVTCG